MQQYFDNRNMRSLRYIENPTDDSYINAFNKHNEQPVDKSLLPSKRIKRQESAHRKLPTEPKMFRFEIRDAVEPSEEVKSLIRRHRDREMKSLASNPPTKSVTQNPTNKAKRSTLNKQLYFGNKKLGKIIMKGLPKAMTVRGRSRGKRSTTHLREPENFKVKMIKFEADDAKEPDEHYKRMVKRLRSLEPEETTTVRKPTRSRNSRLESTSTTTTAKTPSTSRPRKLLSIRKHKRTRRSSPNVIKFELEDAKNPDPTTQAFLQQKVKQREVRTPQKEPTLLTMEHIPIKENTQNNSISKAQDSMVEDSKGSDVNSQESKRFFIYKEAPGKTSLKIKKSVNSLPHDVQKVISHLMKENRGAKAYVKYVPVQHIDYGGHLRSYYGGSKINGNYGLKTQPTYVKYVQPVQQVQTVQPVQHGEHAQVSENAKVQLHTNKFYVFLGSNTTSTSGGKNTLCLYTSIYNKSCNCSKSCRSGACL